MSFNPPSPAEREPVRLAAAIRQLGEGRNNAAGVVNLTASATSTTVAAPNCAVSSSVFLFPASARAAVEFAAGTLRVDVADVGNGQFIINHVNTGQADRTFYWIAFG